MGGRGGWALAWRMGNRWGDDSLDCLLAMSLSGPSGPSWSQSGPSGSSAPPSAPGMPPAGSGAEWRRGRGRDAGGGCIGLSEAVRRAGVTGGGGAAPSAAASASAAVAAGVGRRGGGPACTRGEHRGGGGVARLDVRDPPYARRISRRANSAPARAGSRHLPLVAAPRRHPRSSSPRAPRDPQCRGCRGRRLRSRWVWAAWRSAPWEAPG